MAGKSADESEAATIAIPPMTKIHQPNISQVDKRIEMEG